MEHWAQSVPRAPCGVGCRVSTRKSGAVVLDTPFLSHSLKPPNCGEIAGPVGFHPRTSPQFSLVVSRHTNAFSLPRPWPMPSQGTAKTARALGSRRVGEGGAGADRRSGAANLSAHTSFPTGAGAQANPPPPHLRLRGAPWVGSGVNNWQRSGFRFSSTSGWKGTRGHAVLAEPGPGNSVPAGSRVPQHPCDSLF